MYSAGNSAESYLPSREQASLGDAFDIEEHERRIIDGCARLRSFIRRFGILGMSLHVLREM